MIRHDFDNAIKRLSSCSNAFNRFYASTFNAEYGFEVERSTEETLSASDTTATMQELECIYG